MAATLVLDPTEGGWNIVNYDDFRNSMSAFIDRSFIPYPSEDSGITDEQAIDEVAGYLGASGWTTTSELEDEAGTAGLRGFLEDEESQLERKPRNKRDVQMKESSKKTATSYEFWDKDDSDPSFITGQYGIPGDYVNSRQWNAIQIDDGRWDVSVVGDDGFPKEVGLYRTISEAGSALLQYLNENGTTASFNREGRMSASVRKSYIGSFWGDTQDNGFGGYEYYYGEDGEENNSVMLYGTPDGDKVECQVMSPEGDTLDSYSADSWEEAKGRFDTDCVINHMYEDCIYDPQDPYLRFHETASVKTASAYEFLDDYTYGDPDDEGNSVTLEVVEDGDEWDASIFAPDGNPGELNKILDDGWFESEEDAIEWFKNECASSSRIKQVLDENRSDTSATASVKKSSEFRFWSHGDDEIPDSYGEEGNELNSFEIIIDTFGGDIVAEVWARSYERRDIPCAARKEHFTSVEEAQKWAEDKCVELADQYLDSDFFDDSLDFDEFFFGDSTKRGSVKTASTYEFFDDYTYGDPNEKGNSVTLELTEEDGGYDASIFGPEIPGELPELIEGGWFYSEAEVLDWFKGECMSSSRIRHLLDKNSSDSSTTASVKTSMDEDTNGYSFWGEEPTEDGGFSVWYGEFQEPQNSLPVDVEYYDASSFSYDPDDPGYFTISLRSSTEWDAEDISSEISDVSHDTLDETWQELKEDLPLIAPNYLIPIEDFDELKANGEIETASVRTSGVYSIYAVRDSGDEISGSYGIPGDPVSQKFWSARPDDSNGWGVTVSSNYGYTKVFNAPSKEDVVPMLGNWLDDSKNPDAISNGTYAAASKKASQDFHFWSYDNQGNDYYGDGTLGNSFTIFIMDMYDKGNDVSAEVWSPERYDDAENFPVAKRDHIPSVEEAQKWAESKCIELADQYLDHEDYYATASVKTSKITNSNGYEFDDSEWDAIANLMDDEVREQVANELDDPTNQEFFDAYAKAHEDKFGEEWELDKANPVW